MNQVLNAKRKLVALVFTVFTVALIFSPLKVFAHGGEDHSEKKAPVVSTSANMIVRTAQVNHIEITLKHPPVAPDQELSARVFVTRFETNEPIGDAKVFVAFTTSGTPIEAKAEASHTPGIYEVKFPPLPRGDYVLASRVEVGGATEVVEFGALQVAPVPPAAASESFWGRAVLLTLGMLVGLAFLGFILYRTTVIGRRDRIKREAAAA